MTAHLECCACGHANDHVGRPCPLNFMKDGNGDTCCPCLCGIRVDVATFRVMVDLAQLADQQTRLLAEMGQTMARILAVIEETAGMKSRLVDAGNGRARVEVKPKIVVVGG